MKRIILVAAVFLAVPCLSVQADELDEIVLDLEESRVMCVEVLDSTADLVSTLNRLALVCTAPEKQAIVEPFILATTSIKESLNGIISSIDAYTELCKPIIASKNKADKNSLMRIHKIYYMATQYCMKQYIETFTSHDLKKIETLAVSYGITF